MTDLGDRFLRLDRVAAPDLWDEIVERATVRAEVESLGMAAAGSPTARRATRATRPALVAAAVLVLLLLALVASLLVAAQRSPFPAMVYLVGSAGEGIGTLYAVRSPDEPVVIAEGVQAKIHLSPDGRFVLVRRDESLLLVPTDGSPERLLPTGGVPGRYFEDVWAGDSHAVAFMSGTDLHVISPDGDAPDQVIALPEEPSSTFQLTPYELFWSPDDRHILVGFRGMRGQGDRMFTLLVDTSAGTVREIGTDLALATAPAWSSDGTRIAAQVDGGLEDTSIVLIDVPSLAMTELVQIAQPSNLSWSADGLSIRWTEVAGDATVLRRVAATGGAVQTDAGAPADAVWSPDRRAAAWTTLADRTNSRSGELWVQEADDAEPRRIADGIDTDGPVRWPMWSADGTWIAVGREQSTGAGGDSIWVVSLDGREERLLGDGPWRESLLAASW